MDENKITEKSGYQNLGKKVFWLFFLQNSPGSLILLLIFIILFVLSFQPVLINSALGNIQKPALIATLISFILFIFFTGVALASAWFSYINYTFMISDDSLKIRRGIMNKIENAIPYRQIQNVDVERSFLFQVLGLSRLIILTAGHEDETPKNNDEAEGIIPAVDSKLAEWLQTELLKRADIQKTIQVENK